MLSSLTIIAVLLRRKPYLLVGWLWFLGTLLPMIGLIQIGSQHIADRYLYFPAIGIYIAVVWFISNLVMNHQSRLLTAAVISSSLLIALTAKAHVQARSWKSSESLARRMLEVAPTNNIVAHLTIADILLDEGRVEAGLVEDEAQHRGGSALAVRPGDGDAGVIAHDPPEQFGVFEDPNPALASRGEFGVGRGYGCGRGHEIGMRGEFGPVHSDADVDPQPRQPSDGFSVLAVRSGDTGPGPVEHFGQGMHAAAADADHVNV